ncbi:MAG TPA: outer membrane beta-barrel protein [Xanthobacteraceae bacterium]|nr:outer membrane beta-barrel protein [Xanthobacteraceae bacterium]
MRKTKARRPPPPPGVIPKFGNGPGWGAGKTGFNSRNVPMRRKRSPEGVAGPDADGREPAAKPVKKPPGLALPPPPPSAARRGKPRAATVAAPPRPSPPPGAAVPLAAVTPPGQATAPEATGVVPPTDAVTLPVPLVVPPRPRPFPADEDPFGPTGIHAGTFFLRPALEVMTGYDTNPARLVTNPKGSTELMVAPELLAKSDWERHQLDVAIRGAYYYYPDVRLADRPNLDARADGRIDVTKDTRIDVEGRYLLSTDYPGSPNIAADFAKLPIYTDVGATLGVGQRFNRLDLSLKGTVDRIEWQDSLLTNGVQQSNADRNYNQYGGILRGSYEVSPGLKPFVEADADTRVHDLSIDRTGADRDSDGVAVKAGTAFEFTRTLTGEISVGYLNRFYVDPNLPNIHAPLLDASLTWAASALTTIKFVGTTNVNESVLPDVSGVLVHNNGLEVSHALRRWLIATAKFSYEIDDYIGSLRQDHRYVASLGMMYKLNRDLWFKGELREEWLSSNIPNSNYAATIALLGLRLQR